MDKEQIINEDPLIKFSLYSAVQINTLNNLSAEITGILDVAMDFEAATESGGFSKAYGLFWLWVLGAYEVTRTMYPANSACFSSEFQEKLRIFKKEISPIRMPFAKQENKGKKGVPITNEASIAGFDDKTNDMIFHIENKNISSLKLFSLFDTTFNKITPDDIISDHRKIKNNG